jgi:GAF domain-containing protein
MCGTRILTGESFVDSGICVLRQPQCFKALVEASQETLFRIGEGMLGDVIATGKPEWVFDFFKYKHAVRLKKSNDFGMKSYIALPVLVGEEVVAVLEFFNPRPSTLDNELMHVMVQVGTQLGRVTERTRAEEALRKRSRAV